MQRNKSKIYDNSIFKYEFFDYLDNYQEVDYQKAKKNAYSNEDHSELFRNISKTDDNKFFLVSSLHFILVIIIYFNIKVKSSNS